MQMSYFYILGAIFFNVLGQIIAKWRMAKYSDQIPESFLHKVHFLITLILDPFILATYFSLFFGALCWLIVLNKFELSYAYPFTSLATILIFLLSVFLFGESFTIYKILGIALIMLGLVVLSRGAVSN